MFPLSYTYESDSTEFSHDVTEKLSFGEYLEKLEKNQKTNKQKSIHLLHIFPMSFVQKHVMTEINSDDMTKPCVKGSEHNQKKR